VEGWGEGAGGEGKREGKEGMEKELKLQNFKGNIVFL
jgi:hypothetical protein